MIARKRHAAMLAAVMFLWMPLASAGHWIVPTWPDGKEPSFKPVPYLWFEVKECPLIYRTEIEVPKDVDRATALVRTSGYVYVHVDGRQIYAWAPREKTKDQPAVPADPKRIHELDLSPQLTPGRHILTISAPAKGFVLDGGLYAGTQRLAPLSSSDKWTATRFAPTTVIEDEPIMKLGHAGPSAPTRQIAQERNGELDDLTEWTASEDALAKAHYAAFVRHCRTDFDDAIWRLQLMVQKGIYILHGSARGWGGPARLLDGELLRGAQEALRATGATGWKPAMMLPPDYLEQLEAGKIETVKALSGDIASVMRRARTEIAQLRRKTDALSEAAGAEDEARALLLALKAAPPPKGVVTDRNAAAEQAGLPVIPANESRYDRLGWINHPQLTDSDIGRWGVRINPAKGPTTLAAPNRWLFSTDSKDEGIKELRHSIGYNIETQWPTIEATRSWAQDKRFADYKGIAWYRTRIHIPSDWAGNEVVLTLPVAGAERLWLNDKEITDLGSGQGKRTYNLPADLVAYGGENFLAVRVQAEGPAPGIVGPTQASCPSLEGDAAKSTPPVDVLATPLSPCVILTPRTDTLQIHHGGKAKLLLPGRGRPLLEMGKYEVQRPGPLPAGNWALLWLAAPTPASPQRPILLIFEKGPLSILCEQGITRVRLSQPGQRVIAVRPWAKAPPPPTGKPEEILTSAQLWSRAALAVPMNYLSLTTVLKPGEPIDNISIANVPHGPLLGQTALYEYLDTKDEWDTKPLKLAPLPALCSFALDCKFRTLKLDQQVEVLQDGGLLAPYRGIRDADKVSYSYEVEPYPRFAGFTSWMFAGSDTGVPGNKRELELMASVGANSYRPQHNFCDEKPPKWLDPGDGRNRLQILADACNKAGINYMNNIDQTLGGPQQFVRDHYAEFMDRVGLHYEKIARMLTARPFWAVAYDLINEPFDHRHEKYNPAMKELTRRVRAIDKTHLCYVEPCETWGAIQALDLVEPTGDPLTVYSFHDYNFRLFKPADRWPTLERDISNIYQMWLPAIVFQIKHGVPMHCGEFGGFDNSTDDSLAQTTLLNDFFRIFDQFGMHHHYYSGRQIFVRLADGSLRPSNVARAYREYFRRPDFNRYYPRWSGQPEPAKP